MPETRCIDDVYGHAFNCQFVAQRIPRRAGNFGHDRDLFLSEAIQQTRLADVGLADQGDLGTITQYPALFGDSQQSRYSRSQAGEFFHCVATLKKIDFFLGKI